MAICRAHTGQTRRLTWRRVSPAIRGGKPCRPHPPRYRGRADHRGAHGDRRARVDRQRPTARDAQAVALPCPSSRPSARTGSATISDEPAEVRDVGVDTRVLPVDICIRQPLAASTAAHNVETHRRPSYRSAMWCGSGGGRSEASVKFRLRRQGQHEQGRRRRPGWGTRRT